MRPHLALVAGGAIVVLVILVAVFASWLAPHDPYAQNLLMRRLPPFWHLWLDDAHRVNLSHPLGTDKLGRDYLSRLIYGAQISVLVAFASVGIASVIGIGIGLLAGYFGGWVDRVVVFFISARLSVPITLIAITIVSLYGSALTVLVLVFGLMLWDRFAVVARNLTAQVAYRDFVSAAKILGCPTWYILLYEILPNIAGPLIVVATLEMAHAILLEAAVSFLGMGVAPPAASWGLMLSDAKEDIYFHPWMIAIPGCSLFLLVLAINVSGDALRDLVAREET